MQPGEFFFSKFFFVYVVYIQNMLAAEMFDVGDYGWKLEYSCNKITMTLIQEIDVFLVSS